MYPLKSIKCDHVTSTNLEFIKVMCFVFKLTLTKSWFLIGLWVLVRLTFCKQGHLLFRNWLTANPGLKVNQSMNFFLVDRIFSLRLFCVF